jgi:hypothetical protein
MYETPDWIQIAQDVGILIGVIAAVVGAVAAVGRFLIVRPLEHYIDQRTPRNGGKSLGDLHQKVDVISDRIVRIEKEIIRIDGELDHLVD